MPTKCPEKLVSSILQPNDFSSVVIKYAIDHEKVAFEAYIAFQQQMVIKICCITIWFIINPKYCFLGASLDGAFYNSYNTNEPFMFVEIKSSYS